MRRLTKTGGPPVIAWNKEPLKTSLIRDAYITRRGPFRTGAVLRTALLAAMLLGAVSCSAPMQQVVLNTREPFRAPAFNLKQGDVIALIAATNNDNGLEYRKLLGDFVEEALKAERPGVKVIPYWQTLSVVNREGHTAVYSAMLKDYASTGILDKRVLNTLADSLGAGYFAQPRILDFSQKQTIRFNPFGLTLFQTYETQIKIYLEIWDGRTGEIAWIGVAEANLASDNFMARPVSFEDAAKVTIANLMKKMPPGGE
ncbi:MAG: hypothetical protein HY894_09195 [Deltaproteobacteria bacterium]|nr:hypothetical protein [Deltaproteobacteria bacterium]